MDLSFQPTPHTEAAALIRGKPALAKKVFDQLLPELRNRAFTVTGIESANALQTLREQVAGLPEGETWDSVKAELVDTMAPFLGEAAGARATLLLRSHAFQAFQASNWKLAQEDDDTTHLQYLATEDDRVRDSHLALNGIVLPKDDPFWDLHYPPWEWNCRCRVRSMNEDAVADEKAADAHRPPEGKLVMEGAARRTLEQGLIVRPQFPTGISVLPDERPGAFRFHPDNLTIPLEDLKHRYDSETWSAFEENAKQTLIQPGLTVWDWLKGRPGNSAPRAAQPPLPVSSTTAPATAQTRARSAVKDSAILPKGGKIKDIVQFTLDQIDGVHGDGGLPAVTFGVERTKGYNGVYYRRARQIKITPRGPTPELTTAHEVGHWIDDHAFGRPFASETTLADDWHKAIMNTDAVRQLQARLAASRSYRERAHIADYLLSRKELWARSYAQFIAERSGNATLMAQLRDRLDLHGNQWQTDDFIRVGQEIEKLLKSIGWI